MRLRACWLYRRLLREGERFFDPIGSWYIKWRTRDRFARYRSEKNPSKINKHIGDGMQLWRKLKRANRGDYKDAQRVINLAYGATGKIKHLKERYNVLAVSSPHQIPALHSYPALLRLMLLCDRKVFQESLREYILPLPRHQRRLYVDLFDNKSWTTHPEPEHFKTELG